MEQPTTTILLSSVLNLASLFLGSFLTYYYLQIAEKKKEATEIVKLKRQICSTLIAKMKSQMRLAFNFEKENIKFNFYKRLYVLPGFAEERKETNKEQAFIHQQKSTEYHSQLLKNMEIIEKYKFDLGIYFELDDQIENLFKDYGSLSFNEHENFSEFMDIHGMDEHMAKVIRNANNRIQDKMGNSIEKLEKLLKNRIKVLV